jgi:hypothetical protein
MQTDLRCINLLFALTIVPLALAGCTTSVDRNEALPTAAPVAHDNAFAATYAGRYLLTSSARTAVEMAAAGVRPDQSFALGAAAATELSMGGTQIPVPSVRVLGDVTLAADAARAGLHAADSVARTVGSDGRLHFISEIHLPDQVSDVPLPTAQIAREFFAGYVEVTVRTWATAHSRRMTCIYQCQGPFRVYQLDRVGPAISGTFDPATLFVGFDDIAPLDMAVADKTRDAGDGFQARWTSTKPNSYPLFVDQGTNTTLNDQGQMTTVEVNQFTLPNIAPRAGLGTALVRSLLRALTRDGFYTVGSYAGETRYLARCGRLFELGSQTQGEKFIAAEMIDP